jgi:hypothetical protein
MFWGISALLKKITLSIRKMKVIPIDVPGFCDIKIREGEYEV